MYYENFKVSKKINVTALEQLTAASSKDISVWNKGSSCNVLLQICTASLIPLGKIDNQQLGLRQERSPPPTMLSGDRGPAGFISITMAVDEAAQDGRY